MSGIDEVFSAAARAGYGVVVVNNLTVIGGDQTIDNSQHADYSAHLAITNPRPSMLQLSDGAGYHGTVAPLESWVGDAYRAYRRDADEAYFNRSR